MKKTLIALAAAAGLALAVLPAQVALAAPAATDTSASIALTITDRADTGTGSPTVWAYDTFGRTVKVTTEAEYLQPRVAAKTAPVVLCDVVKQESLLWKYKVAVTDKGTFKTANNSATGSPGEGKSLIKDATGSFSGGAIAWVIAPAHWCSWNGDDYNGGTISGELTGSTQEFIGKLFGKHSRTDMGVWGWTYDRCYGTDGAEKWVNASNGDKGDIRGKACPSASPSPSASASASPSPSASSTTAVPAPSLTPVGATLPVTGANTGSLVTIAGVTLALGIAAVIGSALWRRRQAEQIG